MHGTTWRPSVENLETVLAMSSGCRGKTHAEIAHDLGVDPELFSSWLCKMDLAIAHRPHALASIKFISDLRRLESPPASIQPSDIQVRKRALERAAALAATMPAWPNPEIVWSPEPDGRSHGDHGWDRDETTGEATRRARLPRGRSDRLYRAKVRHPVTKESVDAFPKTIAAAVAGESSAWDLGDALIAECGEPPKFKHGPDGSYARLEAAREALAKNGIEYAANTLRKIRNIAFVFPAARRRTGASFCMHQTAGTPDALDKCISALPAGEKLSVDFIHMHTRGRPRRAHKPGIAALTAQLVAGLKMLTKPLRIAAVSALLVALDLRVDDLAGAHLGRAPVVDAPVQARAVA